MQSCASSASSVMLAPIFSAAAKPWCVYGQPSPRIVNGTECRNLSSDKPCSASSVANFLLRRLAQPDALVRPSHWRMIADIRRFYAVARARLDHGTLDRMTLGAFLEAGAFGNGFRHHFLVPVVSAVWSTAAHAIMDFPVDYLLRFLDNHGLIGFGQGKPWRTVMGGSRVYIDRLIEHLPAGSVVAGDPVVAIRRDADGASIVTEGGRHERFDAVVLATHADEALALGAVDTVL